VVLEDEFTKILLDKIIHNVISCLSVIENISELQHEKIKDCIGINNRRDFVLGALWCTILEKFLVASYLYTGKNMSYEQSLKVSEYILEKIKSVLMK
jgi:hypothetical protein